MVGRIGESVSQAVLKMDQTKEIKKADVPKHESVEETQEKMVPLKKEELAKFAEQVNTFLQPTRTHVQFEYHDELQEYYAVVVDSESEEMIREIPAKKMMDMYAAMNEFIGLLFDKKA
jgi:flagellar protein FlaG